MARACAKLTTIARIGGAVAFCCLSTSLAFAENFDAQGWREFPKQVILLKDTYKGNYERTAIKKDIFIFQKKVIIDKHLQTNGGDVLIVADEVLINAPIDTRVRFRLGPNYWVDSDPANPGGQSLGWLLGQSRTHLGAYDSLYLWREEYDPKTKRFVFKDVPRRPKEEPPTFTDIPQLPSAQVPLATPSSGVYKDVRPPDGKDAPDPDVLWENVRSGNITIFANQIQICPDCVAGLTQKNALSQTAADSLSSRFESYSGSYVAGPNITPGDAFDIEQSVFLQASGLKGGRGAAGSLAACPRQYHPIDTDPCALIRSYEGGLSGKPGRGGDAGLIELHFVNRSPTSEDITVLRNASQVEGGFPAQTHQQRATCYACEGAKWKDRRAFENKVPVPNLGQLRGKSGTFSYGQIDTDTALRLIHQRLLQAELAGNYSIDLLVEQAASDRSVFSISPADTLRPFFAQELARLQASLLDVAIPALRGSSPISLVKRSSFYSTLSCSPTEYTALLSIYRSYLRKICEFNTFDNQDSLRSFFYRTGGLFRGVPTDVNDRIRHREILSELNRTQDLVITVRKDLKDLHLFIYDIATAEQKRKLLEALDDLRKRRSELEAAYEANQDPGLRGGLQTLGKIGGNFAEGYAALVASDWVTAGQKMYDGAQGLNSMWTANRFPPTAPNFRSIDEAIQQALLGLELFAAKVQETRRELVGSRKATLKDLIDARDRLEQYRMRALFYFEDLLRAAIQEYVQNLDTGRLQHNIEAIRLSADETRLPIELELFSLRNLCGSPSVGLSELGEKKAGCVEFQSKDQPYAVMSNSDRLNGFPLVVIPAKSGSHTHSLGELFTARELGQGGAPSSP
jgi:hypothetical protein